MKFKEATHMVLGVILAVAMQSVAAQSVRAEVKTQSTNAAPGNAEVEAAGRDSPSAVAGRSSQNRQGYLLRCWNYGRLVYEGPVSGPAQSGGSAGITIPVASGRPKQILDMKQGLCIID